MKTFWLIVLVACVLCSGCVAPYPYPYAQPYAYAPYGYTSYYAQPVYYPAYRPRVYYAPVWPARYPGLYPGHGYRGGRHHGGHYRPRRW